MSGLLKISLVGVLATGLAFLFWPYVIPGLVLSLCCKGRHEGWVVPAAALAVVGICHAATGEWPVRIPAGSASPEWPVAIMRVVLSWATATILLGAGFKLPRFFAAGSGARNHAARP